MQVDCQWDVLRGLDSYKQQTHAKVQPTVKQTTSKTSVYERRRERKEQRTALEKEVTRLQKSLSQELNLRNALNRGLHRALGSLPRIPNDLPVETRKLLFEVAVLEEEVVSLEKQVVCLRDEVRDGSPALDPNQIIAGKAVAEISTVLQIRKLHSHPVIAGPSRERCGDHHQGILAKPLIAGTSNHETSLRRVTARNNLRDQGIARNNITPDQHEVSSRRSSYESEGLADLQAGNGPTVQSCKLLKKEDGRLPTSNQARLKAKDPVVAKMLSSIQATKTLNNIHKRSGCQGSLQKRNPTKKAVPSRQNAMTPRPRQHQTLDSRVPGTSKRNLIPSPTSVKHGSTESRISASALDTKGRSSRHGFSPQIQYGELMTAQLGNLPGLTKKGGFHEVPQDTFTSDFTTSSSHKQSRLRTQDPAAATPMLDFDHITVSNKLSEEVVRLLHIIYGNIQAGPTSLPASEFATFLTTS